MNFKFQFLTNNQNQFILEKSIINSFSYDTSSQFLQELMFLGFEYALNYSFSLNLENFKNHFYLSPLLRKNNNLKFTYLWRYSSNIIKIFDINKKNTQSFIKFFEFINTYKTLNPVANSLHFMINSGAKANWGQLLQLIGFRGYLSNINGYLYEIPIMQNFNKGLNLYEYFISCYGTRKGVIDTALKTADSGYLTRRLIETGRNIIIKEYNCGTKNYISYDKVCDHIGNIDPNKLYLQGKYLNEIIDLNKNIIYKSDNKISLNNELFLKISSLKLKLTGVYSCISGRNICNNCFGQNNKNNNLGESIGILAAQTIGEPATQLTLRTFHTGGVFTKLNDKIKFEKNNNFNKFNLKLNLNMKVLSFKKLFKSNLNKYKNNFNKELISFNDTGIIKNFGYYKQYSNFYNVKKLVKLKFKYLNYNINNIYNENQLYPIYIIDKFNKLLKKNNIVPQNLIFKDSYEIINNKLIILITKNKINQWILKTLNTDIIFFNSLKTIFLNNKSKIITNFNNYYLNNLQIKEGWALKFSNIVSNLNYKIFKLQFKLKTHPYNIYNTSTKQNIKINFPLINNL
uniref:DNA-directed RNA polymerase n=1 Tax=Nephromyces sp. ex Molgula occidentalis TaxID=2544991 RepID=A0A5C1H869_9APIC|nr:plastid-encoded DNA-directed RNA polymerase beta''A [Nephromyces sp. ex Molgula occidentalis]